MPACARRTCKHGIQRHHNGTCSRCAGTATPCTRFLYPARDPRAEHNPPGDPHMAHKPRTTARTSTVQLGLAAALGEGSTAPPERRMVPLDDIDGWIEKPDPKRYPKAEWENFVESIRNGGLDQDIILRPHEDAAGKPWIFHDGRHRALAHKLLKLAEVPATIRRDLTEGDAAISEVRLNDMRAPSTPAHRARRWAYAKEHGKTIPEIAAAAGVAESTVGLHIRLADLPDDILEHAGDGIRQDALELLLRMKEANPIVYEAGLKAARANKTNCWAYRLLTATDEQLKKDKRAIVVDDDGFADIETREDPKLKKALRRLETITLRSDGYALTVCLEPEKAKQARDEALERLKEVRKTKATKTDKASGKPKVDVAGMVERRFQRLQLQGAVRVAKAHTTGLGQPWLEAIMRRFLQTQGLIASRKVERAAFEEATGIKGWNGRSEFLTKHVEKVGWDTAEGARILTMALHLSAGGYRHDVGEDYAKLTTGKGQAAMRAQAKAEIAAELKEDKAAAKKPTGKVERKAQREAALQRKKDLPFHCLWGGCGERFKTEAERETHAAEACKANPDSKAYEGGVEGSNEAIPTERKGKASKKRRLAPDEPSPPGEPSVAHALHRDPSTWTDEEREAVEKATATSGKPHREPADTAGEEE